MREEINTHGGHSGPKAERFLLGRDPTFPVNM
jgi:hypothetical protein